MARHLELAQLDLAGIVRPGDTVAWGQATAEPQSLTEALMAQRHAIGAFGVFLGISCSATPRVEFTDSVSFSSYCGSGTNRALAAAGKLDILPCHYSQLPQILAKKVDVLMLQLAPPDPDGNYSLGLALEYLAPLLDSARVRIAEVNDQVPWTFGERTVRDSDLDYVVHTSRPALEMRHPRATEVELAIARRVAALVEDGATVQLGLGALPEAILAELGDRRDLGVHTGAMGDAVADLMQRGVITNARKSIDPGVTVAGVLLGSRRLFQFAHRNPAVRLRAVSYTHGADVLARIDRFVAVNAAVEVDLTGQVNAETARGLYVGAVGGAGDFLRAAARSRGGLPIIALQSTAGSGKGLVNRIVHRLSGPVSTPRSDAGIVVTEHGVADLRGLSLSQRVRRMIEIAHPDFRGELEAKEFVEQSRSSC